jgi:cytidylate kinase
MSAFIIAIDGPAASGKGTLARRLAAHFGLAHLDTGSLYRAVGRDVLKAALDPADPVAAEQAAASLDPASLDDPRLRDEDVGRAASQVAAHPRVRAALLAFQRRFAATPPGAVLDGRDIGTVICPDAQAKLFVTASPEVRATRRAAELTARGDAVDYAAVLEDIRVRDERDSGRSTAPLRQADDAVLVDTSDLTADAVFDLAIGLISGRLSASGATPTRRSAPPSPQGGGRE